MRDGDGGSLQRGLNSALHLALAAGFALAVAACDTGPKDPPPDLLKGHRQSMERAKDVERTLEQSSDRRREEADRQGK